MIKLPKLILVVASSALYCSSLQAMPGGNGVVPQSNWADSYSADGRCYIDSNFDHGISNEVVSTPIGNQTVRQVADKIGRGPGRAGNPIYNDVQCGNGPANNAGDEDFDQCPGRVDMGAAGCSIIGPKWDLAAAYDQAQPQPQPESPTNPSPPAQPTNPPSTEECSAWGDDLADAKQAFATACPTATQRDCDPVQNRTLCANVPVETLANIPSVDQPTEEPVAEPEPTEPETPQPPVTQPDNPQPVAACYVTKNSLGVAKRAFAAACPAAGFRDCDPINGQWVCANAKVETLDLNQPGTNPMEPIADPDDGDDTPAPVTPVASDVCYSVASTLQTAKQAYAAQCSVERSDCDPVNGVWVCASTAVESIADLDTGAPVAPPAPEPTPPQPDEPDEPEVPSVPDTPVSDTVKDSRNLLSLHYDCAPDRDDGHANVAGKVLADVFNIKPHVVVGAYGYRQRGAYNAGCEPIFEAAWRSGTALDSGYVNAFQDRNGAVDATVNLWRSTVQAGGQVFVAEGGPSDFTYEVLVKLNSSERSRVTVVQHSGWNQDQTQPSNLNYVRDNTNYIKIDDGNGGGATADLNQLSSSFVTRALNSRWQVAWSEAFAFLSPDERLDFSDTVEVLYLLDVPKAVVATPDDFADRYFR